MIEAQVQPILHGAILFDAALTSHADEAWFEPAPGAGHREVVGGRGNVSFFDAPFGPCVLRHYRRGGIAARLSADRYLWIGRARTRSFREFHLLAQLHDAGLNVPAPVAARFVRDGLRYRADLVTRLLPGTQTLAERLVATDLDAALAAGVGCTLAGFHAHGAWHADLNAHNVLTDGSGAVWLLDFDRGCVRTPQIAWQQANLARLRRSFLKLGALKRIHGFDAHFWHPLLAAYHKALADRAVGGAEP